MMVRCIHFLLLTVAPAILADAMYFKDGHVAGPYTVLTLTHKQIQSAGRLRKIELTAQQHSMLEKIDPDVPWTLTVMTQQEGEADCTCGVSNVGIWLRPGEIEVPHYLLRKPDPPGDMGASRYYIIDPDGDVYDHNGKSVNIEKEIKATGKHPDTFYYLTPPRFGGNVSPSVQKTIARIKRLGARFGKAAYGLE